MYPNRLPIFIDIARGTDRVLAATAACLAIVLLAATLVWYFPMMLWDHLDFVPIYTAWQRGDLLHSGFLRIHGGHLHTAAYVVLLATTWLSHGRPWLDCVASWLIMLAYAAVVLTLTRRTLLLDDHMQRNAAPWLVAVLVAGLALFPGHLANLQWGWQVAIFLCLAGSALAIACLTSPALDWRRNLVALAATGIALLSFANALALVPIALLALAMRPDIPARRRATLIAPWLLICIAALIALRSTSHVIAHFSPDSVVLAWHKLQLASVALYSLNYIGAGLLRFVPSVAPWAAVLALASGSMMVWRLRARVGSWPWAAFMLYATIGAGLTALARFGEGSDQAFAARYVSFSSLFWLGWIGLAVQFAQVSVVSAARLRIALGLVAMFAAINALQISVECARLGAAARETAQILCRQGSAAPTPLLASLYYAGAAAARERLNTLRALGFAPFDACKPNATAIDDK